MDIRAYKKQIRKALDDQKIKNMKYYLILEEEFDDMSIEDCAKMVRMIKHFVDETHNNGIFLVNMCNRYLNKRKEMEALMETLLH
ncbi:hypothetical protein [Tuberibacillus calidus]|uniref:hypothetical protein n=1 Tax=Tuberibacillus calidus TaxID=340097 RepID=UPI000410D290|nr:hypothetical protein [Tuberibacillus calidus]